jgi:hypothetical protein
MKENGNRTYLTQGLSCWISDIAFSRFRSFCNHVLGVRIGEFPSEQSIFMRQNSSIILCAAVLYLLTNGFYLVKHIIQKTMIPIDMIPLYMMVAASLAMLLFLALCKKYDSPLARFALLGYYTMIIASVTIFMVSCNFHGIGLSISMCYLFVIMIAPTYKTLDTVIICVLIVLSWWLPSRLPYAENYDLFKHFLPNQYACIAVGGAVVVLISLLLGTRDYNGAGMQVIERAIAGHAAYEAFFLKLVLTAITIGVGYKGGEIVPVLFIGATFGAAYGGFFGLAPSFAAGLGMTAVFCGVTNSPLTSILLAYELFGGQSLSLFALVIAISYMLSGYYGLYSEQKIVYSKLQPRYIDRKTK